MQAFNPVVHLHSEGYREISDFFDKTSPPYNLQNIMEFNEMYRRVYPMLGSLERREAEEFVDYMIAHLEQPQWATKIYGVC
jgi:hypothetical protein